MRVFEPRRSGLTRVERAAQARRQRAIAHLDRRQRATPHRRRGHGPQRGGATLAPQAAVLLLLSLLCGAWLGSAWCRDGRLEAVAVKGLRHLEPAEIAQALGLVPGTALADLDPGALASRLAAHDWIETARTLPLPGGRLLVEVVEREPAAVLAGTSPFAVDASGTPFAPVGASELPGLPRLARSGAAVPGEPDAELARAVALARRLPELGLPAPTEIEVAEADDPQGFSMRLPGLAPRIVLGRDHLDARLADLARLLEAARPELERAERVDLRFREQAVLDVSPSPTGAAQAATSRGRAAPSNTRPTG